MPYLELALSRRVQISFKGRNHEALSSLPKTPTLFMRQAPVNLNEHLPGSPCFLVPILVANWEEANRHALSAANTTSFCRLRCHGATLSHQIKPSPNSASPKHWLAHWIWSDTASLDSDSGLANLKISAFYMSSSSAHCQGIWLQIYTSQNYAYSAKIHLLCHLAKRGSARSCQNTPNHTQELATSSNYQFNAIQYKKWHSLEKKSQHSKKKMFVLCLHG